MNITLQMHPQLNLRLANQPLQQLVVRIILGYCNVCMFSLSFFLLFVASVITFAPATAKPGGSLSGLGRFITLVEIQVEDMAVSMLAYDHHQELERQRAHFVQSVRMASRQRENLTLEEVR